MTTNGYGRRKLPYPYSYLVRQTFLPPEQNTGRDYTSEYNQSSMNFYVIAMLPEEQLRFTSALQAGADLIYPDDMVDIQSSWLYAREYPNDFTGGGIVSICDAVAACINDSVAVRNALNSAIGGSGGNGGFGGDLGSGGYAPIPGSVDNATNLISGATCTDDNLYGIAKGIVDTAMQVVTDAYEIIEFATNGLELAAAMSDNFPAWVSAGLGTAAELGNWIQENAHDAFLAYDTLSTRTDLACDLYCLMKDNGCVLTYDDLALFFIGRAAITVVGNSLADLASIVAALTTADEVGTTSLAIMFGTLNLGSRFGGLMGASAFMTVVQSYLDEFDPSWTDCDDCSPDVCDFVFATSPYSVSWTIRDHPNGSPYSVYASGSGYEMNDPTSCIGGRSWNNQIYVDYDDISACGNTFAMTAINAYPSQSVGVYWFNPASGAATLITTLNYSFNLSGTTRSFAIPVKPSGYTHILFSMARCSDAGDGRNNFVYTRALIS